MYLKVRVVEEEMFLLLVCSPNVFNNQYWGKRNLGVRNLVRVSHVTVLPRSIPRSLIGSGGGTGSQTLWDAGIPGIGLTRYILTPLPTSVLSWVSICTTVKLEFFNLQSSYEFKVYKVLFSGLRKYSIYVNSFLARVPLPPYGAASFVVPNFEGSLFCLLVLFCFCFSPFRCRKSLL